MTLSIDDFLILVAWARVRNMEMKGWKGLFIVLFLRMQMQEEFPYFDLFVVKPKTLVRRWLTVLRAPIAASIRSDRSTSFLVSGSVRRTSYCTE